MSFAFILVDNTQEWNWGLSLDDHQDVLIMVSLALKSNEILLFSFLLLWFCCWMILSFQIPCKKFSNKLFWLNLATIIIGRQCGQNIFDLGLISKCDCHQLFILLLWYFKPEASLNYVANWFLFLCYVLFLFLSESLKHTALNDFFIVGFGVQLRNKRESLCLNIR